MADEHQNGKHHDGGQPAFVSQRGPVSREELLRHTEDDPEGAEEFVALLHRLRRERAEAATDPC